MAPALETTAAVLFVGLVMLVATSADAVGDRLGIPPLIGYVALGLLIGVIDDRYGLLGDPSWTVLEFMARAGIIALLFRVGLESKVRGLLSQLGGASLVWLADVTVSAGLGFAAAHWVLGFEAVPSVVVATALTATSVGIPSRLWEQHEALDTEEGARFLDVAELDDISAVLFMAMLFAVLPDLQEGNTLEIGSILRLVGSFLVKLFLFGAACLGFALLVEERMTRLLRRMGAPPAPPVIGSAFVIASVAAFLGFSEAIGAFFAGLAFSRDPQQVELDASIQPLHDMLAPFFFIGVGASIPSGSLGAAVAPGLVLAIAAVVGKVSGAGGPNLRRFGGMGVLLIGVSMVPRAEISMVVMQRARELGSWAAPDELFSAVVLAGLVTSVVGPVALRGLLPRLRAARSTG